MLAWDQRHRTARYSIGPLVAGSYFIATGRSVAHVQVRLSRRRARRRRRRPLPWPTLISVAGRRLGVALLAVPNPRIRGTITSPGSRRSKASGWSACNLPDSEVCGSASTATDGTFAVSVDPATYSLRVFDPSGEHPIGYVGPGGEVVGGAGRRTPRSSISTGDVSVGSVVLRAPAHGSAATSEDGTRRVRRRSGLSDRVRLHHGSETRMRTATFRSDAVRPGQLQARRGHGRRRAYLVRRRCGHHVADFALALGDPGR